jgi:hypothetical protein
MLIFLRTDAEKQVKRFPGCIYKKSLSKSDALEFIITKLMSNNSKSETENKGLILQLVKTSLLF